MLAVAAAGLVLGAGAGAGTALVVAGDDTGPADHGRHAGVDERRGRPDGPGRGGHGFAPPGAGQVPPSTAPEQGESDAAQSDGTRSS